MRWMTGLTFFLLTGCAANPQVQNLTPPTSRIASPERGAATASVMAAVQQGNFPRAIAIEQDWAARFPMDLEFRHLEPAIYLLAKDPNGWENARKDLLTTWRRIRGSVPPLADPSFTIDIMKVGQDTIIADQCYERAGRFGVIYRFTVVSPDNRVRSFFTVESPDADNRIARELGSRQQVFTLDHFRPGLHETVAMLPGLPAYADLRRRVLSYIANPQPISASSNGQGGLSTEGCSLNKQ